MAPVHHVVVDWHRHERGVSHNAAELGGVERSKRIRLPCAGGRVHGLHDLKANLMVSNTMQSMLLVSCRSE